ncbi:MAG: MurR/RpiR family transcriptional regulator [Clostridia bacterium]|nr:MurR/RpiR family transcriptional regulator [Oscillospiraceae bacterium]MBQ6797376.1 MurR/RpiR family transcriptional regulator [Clostridia bacterium]
MGGNLLDRIKMQAPKFSKGQRAIGLFICENCEKAAYMTAAKLGQTVGVSESTVVRFANEIGFEGYPQMQRELQSMLKSKLNSVQRIELGTERLGDGDILSNVMSLDIEMIRRTMEETSRTEFNSAIDAICKAKKVFIIGTRSASVLASFLGYYLSLALADVIVVDPSDESAMFGQMVRIDKNDVVIGISFPRYSRRVVAAMRFACESGAKIIALTDSDTSPLKPYAHHLLLAKSEMASVVDSLAAPMSLINSLIVAIAMRRKREMESTLVKLEKIWDANNVYEKGGE